MELGDKCYFVSNNIVVKEATITAIHGEFYTLDCGHGKAIKLRRSRLYPTREDAQATIKVKSRYRSPYDYDH